MGQGSPNLDLCSAIVVQREHVDIEDDPNGPLTWHHAMLLGTVELCQISQEKGQVGQVMLRPLREQHDHTVSNQALQTCPRWSIACPIMMNQVMASSSDVRSHGGSLDL